MSERISYRDYWISFNPKPVPASCGVDWDWHHDDFDGAPDGNDNRCGCSASLEAAKADIDEQIDELDEDDLASAMMQQLCKELEGGAL
ncbi:hypothetical protein [Rhizobium sp. Root1220]|uniref:hypothetical protein n=1 Tax=Rhizobium sp. Root1220 TaxID=1736432 RepID=UPI0006F70D6B|nr:hypothetical protein [Rhizobium sp. Root1220]KQV83278.1 hypothetical protein ASC90_22055 [Rhizobium sp. Root1220]